STFSARSPRSVPFRAAMVVAFFRARHLHEAEPARSVGTPIPDDGHSVHLSISCIRVDPAHRTARADPGLLLAEFDRETQAFGLATTMGTFSITGIAGLTLGGGLGWLMSKHGLACDNLVSIDLVTADGAWSQPVPGRMMISSGECAAAVETSGLSLHLNTSSTRWARCWPDWWRTPSHRHRRCSAFSVSTVRAARTSSA